jgi:hypothetical protein
MIGPTIKIDKFGFSHVVTFAKTRHMLNIELNISVETFLNVLSVGCEDELKGK